MSLDFLYADELVRKAVAQGAFPAAALLVGRREKVLFRRAYGHLCPHGEMVNEQTRYDVASLTKPLVVGMLTLRAMEKGQLCLWDKLGMFIDAPADKKEITIRQLLTHTAGFSSGMHLWQHAASPEDATEFLLEAPLMAPPGARMQYCCEGYILLGQLLECLYDAPLSDLAESEVFKPLHMVNTGYLPTGGNIAATERRKDGGYWQGEVHDESARFLGGVAGNAGVFSTMDDLALFMQMLASGGAMPDGSRYLSEVIVRTAMENHTEGMNQGRGLGFFLPWYDDGYTGDLFPKETIGHTGFTGTSFALDPTTGLYMVFLTNRICPNRDNMGIYRVRRLLHNAVYACALTES